MTKEPLILVVDDERAIRDFLATNLAAKGFSCEQTSSAEGALALASSLNPDLVLLDLGLPDRDGKEVVAQIRLRSDVPIVVISARDQEQEKVLALDAGADDYLTKPFGLDELFARIRVALRHRPGPPPAGPIVFGDLVWDPENHMVKLGAQEVHLTPLEYKLFAFMASHPGRLLTHGTLLKEVWGVHNLTQTHYVRIAMAALRKKLEQDASRPRLIVTEVGTGYRFFH
jgi:two-component system KDP operon response regulator KdpE